MRLLTYDLCGELRLTCDLVKDVSPYAILSHTWGADEEEVTFDDLQTGSGRGKAGYEKIRFCGEQAKRDGLQYFWVDTCCIDKANHVELSEAITSMYRWYQTAKVCYVYLADVASHPNNHDEDANDLPTKRSWKSNFRKSRWFTRGWTLQELLAPKEVLFFSKEGERLGSKHTLEALIHEITDIPINALRGLPVTQFSVPERLRWAKGRVTKRKEDQAYCLLGIFNVFMPLMYGEGDNAFIRLNEEINRPSMVTSSLKVVEGATFDAYDRAHQGCHPATRVDLLQSIRDWAQQRGGKSIFWLNGMAGTGKSTISWTIAQWLTEQVSGGPVALGASFFFKRGEGDRASAALLFPTIAGQLATKIRNFDVLLARVIEADPQICSKSLGEQFNKLIREPLQQLGRDPDHSTYVVVVDALDECKKEADIRTVLHLWSSLTQIKGIRFRLFLTSRPELVIRLGFKQMSANIYRDMALHEVPLSTIQHDILAFLTDAFIILREEHNIGAPNDALAEDWPGDYTLQLLTEMSVPLFIVAATIYRFIRDGYRPKQRLEVVLQSRKSGPLSLMGHVYMSVLQAMNTSAKDKQDREWLYSEFRTVVGSIVILVEPLSRTALAALLDVPLATVAFRLRPLHSVLQVPFAKEAPIRPLHPSFGEYLTSQELQNERFGVDAAATHYMLWKRCLQLLSGPDGLRENICGLSHPGHLRSEVSPTQVDEYLSPAVSYACRYWVYHVHSSTIQLYDEDETHIFLQDHFLHWLEALSFLDRLADAIKLVKLLQSNVAVKKSVRVSAFLEDAQRFTLTNRFIGELAPLQLYSSAIIFAPQNSVLKSEYSRVLGWIQQGPITSSTWSPELQKLEGHTSSVNAVVFSPNGSLLASASWDQTVRVWSAITGQEVQKLEGHTNGVNAVTFSPDGSLLASASHDQTVRVWSATTGQEVQKLEGHTSGVNAVTFSPDGSLLASASDDQTVRVWSATTGHEVQELEGHTSGVNAVTFSPDGSLLASASDDQTVRVWSATTGQEVQKLEGHTNGVNAVSSSPDGSLPASASWDQTVRVWSATTGQEVQKLDGHTGSVTSVVFSSDGSLLASASHDQTVRVWSATTGQEVQKLEGHTRDVNMVAFYPDGSLLASASWDQTVRVWSAKTGQEVQKLEGHTSGVNGVTFSPDGVLLASASWDQTVRVWSATTGQAVQKLDRHAGSVTAVVFSPDGSLLASASWDRTVRVWSTTTGQAVQKLDGHTGSVTAVAFSSNGSLLASASWDQTVRVWSTTTGQEVQKLEGHTSGVNAVTFSSNGSLLASASWDQTVRVWSATTGQEVQKLDGHTGSVTSVVFSPDGSLLASASHDQTVRVWSATTGQEVQKLEGHTSGVNAVTFSPDGSLLASASHDQTVRLWNASTGHEVQKVEHVAYEQLTFTPDSSALLTNRGRICIDAIYAPAAVPDSDTDHGLLLNYDWIEHHGKKLLWLPQEYRSGVSVLYNNKFAFGRHNGSVSFLEVDVESLERALRPNISLRIDNSFGQGPLVSSQAIVKEFAEAEANDVPAAHTDSGYASRASLIRENNLDAQALDTSTVYSDDTSVETSIKDEFIERLIELLLEDLGELRLDLENTIWPFDGLEEVLAGFATRLGQEVQSSRARKAMVFIHKHRRSIGTTLKQKAARLSSHTQTQASDKEKNKTWPRPGANGPAEVPLSSVEIFQAKSFSHNEYQMSVTEKVHDWVRREEDYSTIETPEISHEQLERFDEQSDEESDEESNEKLIETPELQEYEDLIRDSDSYQWLVSSFRKKLLLTDTTHTAAARIKTAVLEHFSGKDRVSQSSSAQVKLNILVDWDLQYDSGTGSPIGIDSMVAVSGTMTDAQAMTCREYLEQTWPATGMHLMTLINSVQSVKAGQNAESTKRLFGATVTALLENGSMRIVVDGPKDVAAEVAEQLCWLSAACTKPPLDDEIFYCCPSISLLSKQERQADVRITSEYSVVDRLQEPGTCWHSLFRRCVIVKDFPIRRRSQEQLGLEMPLSLIVSLIGSKEVHEFAGCWFLKGFSIIGAPTYAQSNELIWHLRCKEDGGHVSYLEQDFSEVCKVSFKYLEKARHIIGWCSKVQNLCGSVSGNYSIRRSGLSTLRSQGHLRGFNLSLGRSIADGVPRTLSPNHAPASFSEIPLLRIYSFLERKFVLFWDTQDHRGWLVNGLRALLHLLRYSLKNDKDNGGELCHVPESGLREPENPCSEKAARMFLCEPKNLDCDIAISHIENGKCKYEKLSHRLYQFYGAMEKAFEYQGNCKNWAEIHRSHLDGWDLVSVAQQRHQLKPSTFVLPQEGRSWIDFTRSIGAFTFLGEGFGDLIKPAKGSCKVLPCGQSYMAVTTSDVKEIMIENGGSKKANEPVVICESLSMKLIWHSPSGSTSTCNCDKSHSLRTVQATVQVLWPYDAAHLIQQSLECIDLQKHADGAIIFGHSTTLQHYIADLGPPRPIGSPEPQRKIEPIDSGIGSSSSIRSSPTLNRVTSANSRSLLHSTETLSVDSGNHSRLYGDSCVSGGQTIQGDVRGSVVFNLHYCVTPFSVESLGGSTTQPCTQLSQQSHMSCRPTRLISPSVPEASSLFAVRSHESLLGVVSGQQEQTEQAPEAGQLLTNYDRENELRAGEHEIREWGLQDYCQVFQL